MVLYALLSSAPLLKSVHDCARVQISVAPGCCRVIPWGMIESMLRSNVSPPARVQVLLPEEEAERFEAYCKAKGFKKSTLIARLVREFLDRERFEQATEQAQRS